ncbi:hypothetical protein [Psychrobacter sp. AT9]|uniref:hypothetical protein n=1 Tax=Psychrobacter sp. AT9 TaxID=3242893 RepID=UPI0039A609A1
MTALKKTPTPDVHEKVKLPVGVTIDGKCYKDIELHPVTIGASYESQIGARETDLLAIIDLSAMIYVPKLDRKLTYDEVHSMSRQDGFKIDHHRVLLEKKERDQATKYA